MSRTPGDPDGLTAARREVFNDLASGGLCVAMALGLAAVHLGQAGRLHEDFGRDPGPALLPVVLIAALGLSGLGLGLRGWARMARTGLPRAGGSLRALWPAAAALALMAGFLPLRDLVGAAAALTLVGAALAVLAGRGEGGRWPVGAAMGGAAGLGLYGLFHVGLSVPL